MKKCFYLAIAIIGILGFRNICSEEHDTFLEGLSKLWESRFWRAIETGGKQKLERALQFIDNPSEIINEKNKKGNTPLQAAFKGALKTEKNPIESIKFLLQNYELDLNAQDNEGNTFLMNVLKSYNDNFHLFKDEKSIGNVAQEIVSLILESDDLHKLDLNLKNNNFESTGDLARKVNLDPYLAKLIGVNTLQQVPSAKRNSWNPISFLKIR